MQVKGQGYVYVAGRVRQPGEMNGKSGNLNNVLSQLYGDLPIPGNEVLCILDADMVSQSFIIQIQAMLEEDHNCLLPTLCTRSSGSTVPCILIAS